MLTVVRRGGVEMAELEEREERPEEALRARLREELGGRARLDEEAADGSAEAPQRHTPLTEADVEELILRTMALQRPPSSPYGWRQAKKAWLAAAIPLAFGTAADWLSGSLDTTTLASTIRDLGDQTVVAALAYFGVWKATNDIPQPQPRSRRHG